MKTYRPPWLEQSFAFILEVCDELDLASVLLWHFLHDGKRNCPEVVEQFIDVSILRVQFVLADVILEMFPSLHGTTVERTDDETITTYKQRWGMCVLF